jgi:hypothetical protein
MGREPGEVSMALESQSKGRRSQEDATRPSDGSTGTLEVSRKDSGSGLIAGERPDGGPVQSMGGPAQRPRIKSARTKSRKAQNLKGKMFAVRQTRKQLEAGGRGRESRIFEPAVKFPSPRRESSWSK